MNEPESLSPPKFIARMKEADHDGLVESLKALADKWDEEASELSSDYDMSASSIMGCASQLRRVLND